MKYAEKTQTLKCDIIEIIVMCKMEKRVSNFIRDICVATEKVISLITNCQLNNITRFCTSNIEVSVLGIDRTYNIGPCFISSYRHLEFLTKDNVHSVMFVLYLWNLWLYTQGKIIDHITCWPKSLSYTFIIKWSACEWKCSKQS